VQQVGTRTRHARCEGRIAPAHAAPLTSTVACAQCSVRVCDSALCELQAASCCAGGHPCEGARGTAGPTSKVESGLVTKNRPIGSEMPRQNQAQGRRPRQTVHPFTAANNRPVGTDWEYLSKGGTPAGQQVHVLVDWGRTEAAVARRMALRRVATALVSPIVCRAAGRCQTAPRVQAGSSPAAAGRSAPPDAATECAQHHEARTPCTRVRNK
jgi:hypothetical protein